LGKDFPSEGGPQNRLGLVQELREAYMAALLLGEEVTAELIVRDAMDSGLDGEAILHEILTPGMRRIGDLWEEGALTVADEHLASQITLRVLALEREAVRVATGRRQTRVMLAAVEGEEHIIGLQMAENLLASEGYDTRYLGPNVPIDSLATIVEKHEPRVFGLTATIPDSGELLRLAIEEIRRGGPDTAVLLGGSGVPAGFRSGQGVVVARSIAGLVESVDALVRRPDLN
jgi:MerR family transcriptional regulator, light-induced transcriptional regulator